MSEKGRAVTEIELEEALSYVGKHVERKRQVWNTAASADAIRHFAIGFGDDNPLWLDRNYASKSKLKRLVAPPTFPFSIDSCAVLPGLEGLARIAAGQEIECFERIYEGDVIRADTICSDAKMIHSPRIGPMIIQSGTATFYNQEDVLVARGSHHAFRLPRSEDVPEWAYEQRTHRYDSTELAQIEKSVLSEEIRGGAARYFEDVQVGDEIGPLTKGPYTQTDLLCWYAGAGVYGRRPFRLAWRERVQNSDWYTVVPETGAFEYSDRSHYDMRSARLHGMPGPFDNPMQRCSFAAQLFTDWIGDEGILNSVSCRYRRPFVFGDTLSFRAKAVTKEIKSKVGTVKFLLEARNQIGEITTTGLASVSLPLRYL